MPKYQAENVTTLAAERGGREMAISETWGSALASDTPGPALVGVPVDYPEYLKISEQVYESSIS